MTAFFIKTDGSAVGPFTGIELREAALSRIITAKSKIGGSPQGPWTLATETGLFSQAKTPLPHPEGVHVPQYHVRGLSFAAKGPFKLRELIGFAARGMLREDSQLQSDVASEWIPVDRIPILSACLAGELVLLGSDGRMKRKTGDEGHRHSKAKVADEQPVGLGITDGNSDKNDRPEQQVARAPVEVNRESLRRSRWKNEATANHELGQDESEAVALKSTGSFDQAPLVTPTNETPVEAALHSSEDQSDEDVRWWQRSIDLPKINLNPNIRVSDWRVSRRVAICLLVFLAIGGSIATALTQWRSIQIRPEQIVGVWMAEDQSFGVNFRDDGSCVFYHPSGNSWTGQYEWATHHNEGPQFQPSSTVSTSLATASPGDLVSEVKRSDGFLRFQTSAFQRTTIKSQETGDCFLRLNAEALQLGYLTQVQWSSNGKQMEAGWMSVQRQPPMGLEPLSDIAGMEIEPPPRVGFAVEKSLHVSEVANKLMLQYETGDADANSTDGRCYSIKVDADFLLQRYGVPDEARCLLPFDLVQLPKSGDFAESTLVRYGPMRIILSEQGKLQHLSLMQ
jgi:hypothetical protein